MHLADLLWFLLVGTFGPQYREAALSAGGWQLNEGAQQRVHRPSSLANHSSYSASSWEPRIAGSQSPASVCSANQADTSPQPGGCMQVFTLSVVNWQSVKVDESSWWFEAIMVLRFDDALVDVGVLVQVTLLWLVQLNTV